MPLTALSHADLQLLTKRFDELRHTDIITSKRVSDLIKEWEPKVKPDAKDKEETFTLVYPNGKTTGVASPRWLAHLVGLRHRAVHIGFRTETGLVAMQRRTYNKADWPNMLDMAVSGHVPQNYQGHDITYEQGAWKEIEEEIGLIERDAIRTLKEAKLVPIGEPYFSFDIDRSSNPPMYNAEARQVYGATLTGEGLARLRFTDGEVAGLTFVNPETAWDILGKETGASGFHYSMPRFLGWVETLPIVKPAENWRGLGI